MSQNLPTWAEEIRDLFKSGSVSQFILHGNVLDVVPSAEAADRKLLSLRAFLDAVMFKNFEVVLHYNRGSGIVATKGAEDWGEWLQQNLGGETAAAIREPGKALDVLDRYLLRTLHLRAIKNAQPVQRIDQIAATLGGTTQWIKEQQQIYGKVDDLLEEPPPLPLRKEVKEGS